MGNVGGDPSRMLGSASSLSSTGTKVRDSGQPVIDTATSLAGAAGHEGVAAAVKRLAAAIGTAVEDTGVQAQLAAQLAAHSAEDLRAATGTP